MGGDSGGSSLSRIPLLGMGGLASANSTFVRVTISCIVSTTTFELRALHEGHSTYIETCAPTSAVQTPAYPMNKCAHQFRESGSRGFQQQC